MRAGPADSTTIYTDANTADAVNVGVFSSIGRGFRTQGGLYIPGWASWNITFLDQNTANAIG